MAELFKVNAPVRKPLFEGVQGENEARSIQFDITPWVEELGDGAVTATAKRSQDSQPYPVAVTKDGNTVTWKPTSTDTAFAGVGSFQLEYTVDDVLAKTCIWSTMVAPSLDPAGDPPDPYDNWLAEMREIAADAIQAAQDADDSADDAEASAQAAAQSAALMDNYLPINSKSAESQITEETQVDFSVVGELNGSTGEVMTSETAYSTTDFIELDGITGIYRTGTTIRFALWCYCFYDADHTFLGYKGSNSYVDYTIETYDGKQVTWLDIDDYPNAKYIRITKDNSRPYTYWIVKDETTYKYDVPHITVNGVEPLKFYGKTIVNFGDSLFGNSRDTNETTDKSISKMIAEATGAKVYNGGFGGCTMTIHSNYWDAFTMHSVADSVATGDWTIQDNALVSGAGVLPSYFVDTVAMLKTIDWSEVDYITIGYGTNDYALDRFIDYSSGFDHEWDYFKGALEYSIRTILNAHPQIRIAVISPCWRWFLSNGEYAYSSDDPQSVNGRGLMLTDFVEACKTICEKVHVAYVDTYYTLGFNEYTHLEYFPANDGTHPNQNGRQLRADRIIGQMEALF